MIDFAVANVVENAVEHNDSANPRITIETRPVTENGTEYTELRVADNGPGIPDSETAVLERGYETDLEHMSGLGLWTVHWILSNLEGKIRFEANEPRGSVVVLQLQAAPSE